MLWIAAACISALIGLAFTSIAFSIVRGLYRTRQLTKNTLGAATAAIFASGAAAYFVHAFRLVFVQADAHGGSAIRESIDAYVLAFDGITVLAVGYYWGQRLGSSSLLTSGALFADLQRRFADGFRQAPAPKMLQRVPGLSFDGAYVPAAKDARAGGDWYDVFALPQRRIGFMLGDVRNRGLDAAAGGGRVREAIVAAAYASGDPADVLSRVNAMVCRRDLPLVTVAFGIVDIDTLDLRYALAGHPPPLLAHRAGGVAFAESGGLPLGADAAERYRTFDVDAHQGTLLILYTDGLTGCRRNRSDGENRLLRAASTAAFSRSIAPARDLLVSIFGDRPARDDVALLVIKFLGEPRVTLLPDGRRWSFDVSDYEAASDLRRRVMDVVRADPAYGGDFGAVELIVGELLGNVARHTPGAIVVDVRAQSGCVFLTVSDEGSGIGKVSRSLPDDVLSERGRGMFLINALGRGLDVRSSAAGTSVRVELPLDAKTPLDAAGLSNVAGRAP